MGAVSLTIQPLPHGDWEDRISVIQELGLVPLAQVFKTVSGGVLLRQAIKPPSSLANMYLLPERGCKSVE